MGKADKPRGVDRIKEIKKKIEKKNYGGCYGSKRISDQVTFLFVTLNYSYARWGKAMGKLGEGNTESLNVISYNCI